MPISQTADEFGTRGAHCKFNDDLYAHLQCHPPFLLAKKEKRANTKQLPNNKTSVPRCFRDRKKVQRARVLINLRVKQQQREGILCNNSKDDDDDEDNNY
jgi:hypothetical protein